MAGVNSVVYWLSNPIWLGGVLAITALTTFSTFFTDISGTSSVWRYVFLLGFIWFAVWGAILSFNVGKWIPSIGAVARVGLLAFFSLAQTVRVTATDYEVDRLLAQQSQLEAQSQELRSSLSRLGRAPAIKKRAIELHLFPLAEPVVVRAR